MREVEANVKDRQNADKALRMLAVVCKLSSNSRTRHTGIHFKQFLYTYIPLLPVDVNHLALKPLLRFILSSLLSFKAQAQTSCGVSTSW